MQRTLIVALAGALLLVRAECSVAADDMKDVRSDDPEMVAGINKARRTVGELFDALAEAKPGRESFLLKVAFRRGDDVEHIWLADLNFSGPKPRGVIANEPRMEGLRFMEEVTFEPSDVTDWMYVEDGRLVGGYTTRVIRERMSPEERKEFDASAPFKF